MDNVVEARSLSFLTPLASDPPLYPYNPTHSSHGPLTLYIVRVPGSKDVFLTPLKPRDRVVNAQDVQSSLYYLHVDEPEDIVSCEDEHSHASYSVQDSLRSNGSDGMQVSRKPLPTPPMSPIDRSNEYFQERKPPPIVTEVPKRKPIVPNAPNMDLPHIPRRPAQSTMRSFDSSSRLEVPDARRSLSVLPAEGQFPGHQHSSQYALDSELHSQMGLVRDNAQHQLNTGSSLTLIRRDPSTGAQWNVSKIHDIPVQEVSSETTADFSTSRAKRAGAPLFIEISNPGYSKFTQFDQTRPVSRSSTERFFMGSNSPADGVFRRRLWMDGSKFADHSYAQRKQSSMDGTNRLSRSSLQMSAQDFQFSPRAVVDRRSRGYSFRSPWGGKCEFATGVSGRSLKCKYHSENPGAASTEVSELRFNLPPASGLTTPGNTAGTERSSKRSSFIPRRPLHKHTSSEYSTHEVETPDELPNYFDERGNIDLSLGQERAGGGFHGKSAKLGKLIIEDMGMAMLDLTVASNMALWWRAYERA